MEDASVKRCRAHKAPLALLVCEFGQKRGMETGVQSLKHPMIRVFRQVDRFAAGNLERSTGRSSYPFDSGEIVAPVALLLRARDLLGAFIAGETASLEGVTTPSLGRPVLLRPKPKFSATALRVCE